MPWFKKDLGTRLDNALKNSLKTFKDIEAECNKRIIDNRALIQSLHDENSKLIRIKRKAEEASNGIVNSISEKY